MTKRRIFAEAAMFGMLAAAGTENNLGAQQKNVQKTEQKGDAKQEQGRKVIERQLQMEKVADVVKRLDLTEEQKYQQYIKAAKDSTEEKDLFKELNENYLALDREMLKLLDYSTDDDSHIANKALGYWGDVNKNIERRKSEVRKSGKEYFNRLSRPGGPLLSPRKQ